MCDSGKVMEWCQRFLSAGEAFVQEQSEFLRSTIGNQCGKFFETYHQTNLEVRIGFSLCRWQLVSQHHLHDRVDLNELVPCNCQ